MKLKCPKPDCGQDCESLKGLKQHMSKSHDGWTDSDIAEAASKVSGDEGAALLGARDFPSAAASAPTSDKPAGAESPKSRKTREEREQESARMEFARTMAHEMCKSLAKDPWEIMSWALMDERLGISDAEAEPIAQAYQKIVDAMGLQFASTWFAVWIALRSNFAVIKSRLPIIQEHLEAAKPKVETKI
jgi:hypothetical protein